MKILSKEIYRSGEIVSPYRAMRMYESLRRDVERVQDRRYYHTACRIPFDDIDSTDTNAEKQVIIRPPFDIEIDFVELRVNGTSGKTFTVVAPSVTNWEPISVVGDGTSMVEALNNSRSSMAAGGAYAFAISSDGVWSITNAELIIHTRKDRGNSSTAFDKPAIKAGVASDVDAEFVTPFNTYDTITTQETALNSGGFFIVDMYRNFTFLTDTAPLYRHLAVGQTIAQLDINLVGSPTFGLPGRLFQTGAGSHVTSLLSATGPNSTAYVSLAIDEQATYNPTLISKDITVWTSQSGAAGLFYEKIYLVTYYT